MVTHHRSRRGMLIAFTHKPTSYKNRIAPRDGTSATSATDLLLNAPCAARALAAAEGTKWHPDMIISSSALARAGPRASSGAFPQKALSGCPPHADLDEKVLLGTPHELITALTRQRHARPRLPRSLPRRLRLRHPRGHAA